MPPSAVVRHRQNLLMRLLPLMALLAQASASVELAVLDSMVRHDAYVPLVSRTGPVRLALTAAGREHEAVQILLRATVNTTARVVVALPSTLPAGCLRVQRLGFVWATNLTSDVGQTRTFPIACPPALLQRHGGCWVADPLLPLGDGSVLLPAGLTVSLWVTFAAPANPALLGSTHSASIAVAGHTIDLNLSVRKFALPLSPALRNTIHLSISHLHRCFAGDKEEVTNRRYHQYALFVLRELRLNPGSIYDSWRKPGATPCDFRTYQDCFNTSAATLARWVREEGLNAFTIPSSPINQTAPFVAELRQHNISHLASFYGCKYTHNPLTLVIL